MTNSVETLKHIMPLYDGFIIDLWGVMHDGVTAFPAAIEFVRAARAAGKAVGFLSNSSSRAALVARQLQQMGIIETTALVTSGELVTAALAEDPSLWRAGYEQQALMIGETHLLKAYQAPVTLVRDPAKAGAVINVWYSDDRTDLPTYQPLLKIWLAHNLPMICCNPDIIAHTAGVAWLCPGALAAEYASLGGTVHSFGKPHAPAFAKIIAQLGLPASAKLAMIGDNLNTDIRGGHDYGLDTVLILDGVHRDALDGAVGTLPSQASLQALYAAHGLAPSWAVPKLRI
jgi:HAD superfamily hydrolase (TIGR01459 family)